MKHIKIPHYPMSGHNKFKLRSSCIRTIYRRYAKYCRINKLQKITISIMRQKLTRYLKCVYTLGRIYATK